MLKLKIENTHIDSRGGVKDGREWARHEQHGMLSLPSGEVRSVRIEVQPGQPLPVGEYTPGAGAYFMDKYNEPKISMRARNWEQVGVRGAAAPKVATA